MGFGVTVLVVDPYQYCVEGDSYFSLRLQEGGLRNRNVLLECNNGDYRLSDQSPPG